MRSLSNVIKSDSASASPIYQKTIQLSDRVFETEADYPRAEGDSVPILKKAEIKAKNIRKQAEEEAEKVRRQIEKEREQAKKDIQQSLDQARQQGWQEGYRRGMDEGRKQYESLISEAARTVDSAKRARRERLDETEYDILELGVKIAGKIIGNVLNEDRDQWLGMVKRAISEVKEYEEIRLIVHHKWYDFMLSHQQELEALLKKSAELYIYPEATTDELACVIEFPYGQIDASVDSQLIEIKRKLTAKLEEPGNGRDSSFAGN
jgi:flagellar assembly protein FliH